VSTENLVDTIILSPSWSSKMTFQAAYH
jgi:hypothetical protein